MKLIVPGATFPWGPRIDILRHLCPFFAPLSKTGIKHCSMFIDSLAGLGGHYLTVSSGLDEYRHFCDTYN